jgi:glycosyltransferase involved in cell wall biosynthesis
MSHKPRVSVGLPVYNGENFLTETLDCFLGQTFADFEIVISDNGSQDHTEEICRSYAANDARIRYFRSDVNRGLTWNYNRVFELALGQYFKWAAHDDLCGPEFLRRCVETLDGDSRVVACCPSSAAIDDAGRLIVANSRTDRRLDPMGETLLDDNDADRELDSEHAHRRYRGVLLRSTRCYEEFGLIRSDAIRRTNLRGNYRGSEKVFLAEISLLGRMQILPDKLFFPRWHGGRCSANTSAADHSVFVDPTKPKRCVLPRQFACTWGYWRIIWRHRMTLIERLGCCSVFFQFLFQVHKWSAVFREAATGNGPTLAIPPTAVRSGRAITSLEDHHAQPLSDDHEVASGASQQGV